MFTFQLQYFSNGHICLLFNYSTFPMVRYVYFPITVLFQWSDMFTFQLQYFSNGQICLLFNYSTFPMITYVYFSITVLFQWSNSVNTQGVFPDCEDKVYKTYLEYDLYVNYMEGGDFTEGTYFSVMEEMLTAADVSKHGTKVCKLLLFKILCPKLTLSQTINFRYFQTDRVCRRT